MHVIEYLKLFYASICIQTNQIFHILSHNFIIEQDVQSEVLNISWNKGKSNV